jgi:hypothetical protein
MLLHVPRVSLWTSVVNPTLLDERAAARDN